MHLRHAWLIVPCLLALTAAAPVAGAAPPAAAPAGTSPAAGAPRSAVVELDQTGPHGKPARTSFLLSLAPDRTAEVETAVGASSYEVKLTARGGPAAPLLDIQFFQYRPHQRPTRIELSARVPRGARTVLGRVIRPDGSRLSLAVTLR